MNHSKKCEGFKREGQREEGNPAELYEVFC